MQKHSPPAICALANWIGWMRCCATARSAAAGLRERRPAAQCAIADPARAVAARDWRDGCRLRLGATSGVKLARESTTISPLIHGQLLINAAQTAMATNHLDEAEAMTSEGLKRWAGRGPQAQYRLPRVGQTLLAVLQLLRGQPRLALIAFDQIAAKSGYRRGGAPLRPRAGRRMRAHLSLMARHDEAIALARESEPTVLRRGWAPGRARLPAHAPEPGRRGDRRRPQRHRPSRTRMMSGLSPAMSPPSVIAPALPAYARIAAPDRCAIDALLSMRPKSGADCDCSPGSQWPAQRAATAPRRRRAATRVRR
jgi:hypothetical protein